MALNDDFVISVRQIAQNPQAILPAAADRLLIQQGGLGGPYRSMSPADLVGSALLQGGWLRLEPGNGIAWGGATLSWSSSRRAFEFSAPLLVPWLRSAGEVFANGVALADRDFVQGLHAALRASTVWSFDGRRGHVRLEEGDILRAGGVLQRDPTFAGVVTVPTLWDVRQNDSSAASTQWVQQTICHWLETTPFFNGRPGPTVLTTADVNAAYFARDFVRPRAPTPTPGDCSTRIATTEWVSEATDNLHQTVIIEMGDNVQGVLDYLNLHYAPLGSPIFTGHPTAPTPPQISNDGSLATTAYVRAAVQASTAGVASFMGRTGDVLLGLNDILAANGAPLSSPAFSGVPTADTAAVGTNTNQLATCAFVLQEVAALTAGVSSFNGRGGVVSLLLTDITGVGGAPINNPAFTGNAATAVTQPLGTVNTTLATTAFVQAALTQASGVSSFMTRTGAITLLSTDISAASGALLASPSFTGTPQAPTAATATNNTQLATTAFVRAAITAYGAGVSTFNSRAGSVTLNSGDIASAGGAALASPAFIGVPTAPTPAVGDSSSALATTAFVAAAVGTAGMPVIRTFTASGTYAPGVAMKWIRVRLCGAGGGGGGGNAGATGGATSLLAWVANGGGGGVGPSAGNGGAAGAGGTGGASGAGVPVVRSAGARGSMGMGNFTTGGIYQPATGGVGVLGGGYGTGGAGAATGAASTGSSGSGGAGEYVEFLMAAADVGTGGAVVVGLGGNGGPAAGGMAVAGSPGTGGIVIIEEHG